MTFYEAGTDNYLTKNLKFSAEYALVNNEKLDKRNYSFGSTEISLRF